MCFSPHNADSAKISFYDVAEPEKYSKEWAKKIAFADLAFDELQSRLPLMTGFLLLKKQKAGFFRWYTSQPLPRRSKGAIYNSVKMEFHFYGDKVSSAIDFYKDNQFLMSQAHHILVAKTSSNFKKY